MFSAFVMTNVALLDVGLSSFAGRCLPGTTQVPVCDSSLNCKWDTELNLKPPKTHLLLNYCYCDLQSVKSVWINKSFSETFLPACSIVLYLISYKNLQPRCVLTASEWQSIIHKVKWTHCRRSLELTSGSCPGSSLSQICEFLWH